MEIEEFLGQVKTNCTISDARYWGYYSICGLLMRMRELYLSEHSLKPWDKAPMEEILSWISGRENLWKELEKEELREIRLNGSFCGPFEADRVNARLKDTGLLYGCGYGVFHKPSFFVARIHEIRELYDYVIHCVDHELCRDLSAAPAMLQGRCIYVRRDIIRTILWDRFQLMKSRQQKRLMEDMFMHYGIRRSDDVSNGFQAKIDAVVDSVSDLFVFHEVGEAYEDEHSWEWMEILSRCDKQCELYLRAAKDLLADTSRLGPLKAIGERRDGPLLNAYMVFLEGIRREIFPEIGKAFDLFRKAGDWSLIEQARGEGYRKAAEMRAHVLALSRSNAEPAELIGVVKGFIREAHKG